MSLFYNSVLSLSTRIIVVELLDLQPIKLQEIEPGIREHMTFFELGNSQKIFSGK